MVKTETRKGRESMKFLIIRLTAIGDAVHSTIIAQAIKNKYPEAQIHFMTASFIKPLIECSPYVDKVIPFDIDKGNNISYIIKTGLSLLFERYDIIFNLSNTTRNIIMSCLAAPKKIIKRNKNRIHAVDAFFNSAVKGLGELEKPKQIVLKINDEIKKSVQEKVKNFERPFYIFSPGGENDNARQGRIWADEYWIELGNKLTEKYGGTVFICGGKNEKEAHEKFKVIKNSKIFTGELSLVESAALYSISDLFISGDSGPLHIAACFDINIAALYGSTPPESVSPYGHNNCCIEPSIECRFCQKRVCKELKDGERITPCMKSITPENVFKFIEDNKKLKEEYYEKNCLNL